MDPKIKIPLLENATECMAQARVSWVRVLALVCEREQVESLKQGLDSCSAFELNS